MVSNYIDLSAYDVISFGGHAALFSLIIFAFYKALLIKDKKSGYLVIGFFVFNMVVVLLDMLLGVVPDFPDSQKYLDGLNSSYIIDRSIGVYVSIMRVFNFLFYLTSPVEFVLFQKLVMFISLFILANGVNKMLRMSRGAEPRRCLQRNVLFLLFLYPAPLLYTSAPLREFLVLFIFSVYVNALIDMLINQFTAKNITLAALSLILMFFVRFQFVVGMLLPLLYVSSFHVKNDLLRYMLIPGFVGFSMYLIDLYLGSIGYGGIFTPSEFTKLRHYFITKFEYTGLVYGAGVFHTYLDLVIFIPGMFLQFMLAPIPILISVGSQVGVSTIIDEAFILFLSVYLVGNIKIIGRTEILRKLFIVFLLITVPVSLFEFFISSVPRHRIPSILILIVIASVVYSKRKSRKVASVV